MAEGRRGTRRGPMDWGRGGWGGGHNGKVSLHRHGGMLLESSLSVGELRRGGR